MKKISFWDLTENRVFEVLPKDDAWSLNNKQHKLIMNIYVVLTNLEHINCKKKKFPQIIGCNRQFFKNLENLYWNKGKYFLNKLEHITHSKNTFTFDFRACK